MSRSSLTVLVIAMLAVAVTWLNSSWNSYKEILLPQNEKVIDYYLTDFTLLNTTADGTMRYFLKGQNLTHQQSSTSSEIFHPSIQASDNGGGIISLNAESALQENKNGAITLTGEVMLNSTNEDISKNFNLETSDLVYDPLKKELSSKTKVILDTSSGKIKGVGFNSKLDEQALRIHSNVHIEFKPAN